MSNFNQRTNDLAAHATALETSQQSGSGASLINPQTGASYQLKATDASQYLRLTNAGAMQLVVPPNSAVPIAIGDEFPFEQSGAGIVTVTAGAGVTINSRGGVMTTAGQFAVGMLKKTGPDTFTLTGDLA
jgi:hypothetical protein